MRVNFKAAAVVGVAIRVLGQGILAITSFLVSFAAAHTLDAHLLAIFFVMWTLESMWIAALRTIFVPAFLVSHRKPRPVALILIHFFASIPIGLSILCVGIISDFRTDTAILLAVTPVCLGSYEVVRTYLSFHVSSRLSVADATMLVISGTLFVCGVFLFRWDALDSALIGVLVGSFSVTLVGVRISTISVGCAEFLSLLSWAKDGSSLLRVGLLEWAIFFTISMAGVSLLGGLGGAEVLSGVRLAETLIAPLSIAGSAIPLILAPYMSLVARADQQWPNMVKFVTCGFALVAVIWILLIMAVPLNWLEILVGEHGALARAGLAGLAVGTVVSFFSATLSLVLKARGSLKQVRLVRWVQLVISMPLIALGAIWGDVFLAGLGMASHQVIACVLLMVAERRGREKLSPGISATSS